MIEITKEAVLTMAEAARCVPGRNGRRCSIQTLYRWCYNGVRQGPETVRLESIVIGGRRYTSREAMSRFVERLNPGRDNESPQLSPRSKDRRQRDSERAEAELRARQRKSSGKSSDKG